MHRVPDPVLAMQTISIPERANGRVFLCTGVGNLKPIASTPFNTSLSSPRVWKLPPAFFVDLLDGLYELFSIDDSISETYVLQMTRGSQYGQWWRE